MGKMPLWYLDPGGKLSAAQLVLGRPSSYLLVTAQPGGLEGMLDYRRFGAAPGEPEFESGFRTNPMVGDIVISEAEARFRVTDKRNQLKRCWVRLEQMKSPPTATGGVFVAHGLDPKSDPKWVETLVATVKDSITQDGFNVTDGNLVRLISKDIRQRILASERLVAILTPRDRVEGKPAFTASAWVYEEIGAAAQIEIPVHIFAHEKIDQAGSLKSGLAGDVQVIWFTEADWKDGLAVLLKQMRLPPHGA